MAGKENSVEIRDSKEPKKGWTSFAIYRTSRDRPTSGKLVQGTCTRCKRAISNF